MACIPPNPRRVGYIVPIHGPLDGPLYMGSIYTNTYSQVRGNGRNSFPLRFWNVLQTMEDLLKKAFQCCI